MVNLNGFMGAAEIAAAEGVKLDRLLRALRLHGPKADLSVGPKLLWHTRRLPEIRASLSKIRLRMRRLAPADPAAVSA